MNALRLAALRVAIDYLTDARIVAERHSDAVSAREWALSALSAAERSDSPRWVEHCLKKALGPISNGFHPVYQHLMFCYRSGGGSTALPASSLLYAVCVDRAGEFVAQWENWDTAAN